MACVLAISFIFSVRNPVQFKIQTKQHQSEGAMLSVLSQEIIENSRQPNQTRILIQRELISSSPQLHTLQNTPRGVSVLLTPRRPTRVSGTTVNPKPQDLPLFFCFRQVCSSKCLWFAFFYFLVLPTAWRTNELRKNSQITKKTHPEIVPPVPSEMICFIGKPH